VACDKTIN